jgi:peptidoglycan/xylan/chitin deacetylase (PgdA/CDA1 family)
LKVLALVLAVVAATLAPVSSGTQPLDAVDSPQLAKTDLPPAPYIDSMGIETDQKEVSVLPLPDEPTTYLDVFNFQPEEAGLPASKSGYSVSILMYHGFTAGPARNRYQTSAADFRAQLEFLRQNDIPVIPLGDLADAYKTGDWSRIPSHAVIITIDDGQRSVYTTAFPIMKEFGAPFTLAIYTDYVGGKGTLHWDEIKEMMAAGAEIGCHTKSHANLKKRTRGMTGEAFKLFMETETIKSREILEKGTGEPVRYFFYPYGLYTKETQAFLAAAGYDCILTTNNGSCGPQSHNFSLNRNEVFKGISLSSFNHLVTG